VTLARRLEEGDAAKEVIMSTIVEHITDTDFDAKVLESDVPVLVDFWAPWCGPCLMIGPVVEAIAEERADTVKVVKVNVDESPGVAARLGIRSILTIMVFRGGELHEMAVGARPKGELERMLDSALAASHDGTAAAASA
jgi:thioredoxin 1